MLMNDSEISTSVMNEEETMRENEKKFLYARAVHSDHSIQYHMHQVVLDLIILELNLHTYDLVIISQIINMIETDSFLNHKMFESVMRDLRNLRMEGIRKLEKVPMHCTNNGGKDAEMDEVEFIDLCSVSWNENKVHVKGKESTKQESQDKSKHKAVDRMKDEFRTKKGKFMTKNEKIEAAIM